MRSGTGSADPEAGAAAVGCCCCCCRVPNAPRLHPRSARTGVEAAGYDYTPIDTCYGGGKGAEGNALILANAARTAALNPPHDAVPWIVINGKPVDAAGEGDPVWLNAHFLNLVCAAYTGAGGKQPPAACGAVAFAPAVASELDRAPSCPRKW